MQKSFQSSPAQAVTGQQEANTTRSPLCNKNTSALTETLALALKLFLTEGDFPRIPTVREPAS